MATKEPTSTEDVAERLRLSRIALKLTQAALCRMTGLSTAAYNNAETADSRIGLDSAISLCQATGLTLDWIYRGIRRDLPPAIKEAIGNIEAGPARKRA
jgi:transcriptional regulator with XRE-family HTH domain